MASMNSHDSGPESLTALEQGLLELDATEHALAETWNQLIAKRRRQDADLSKQEDEAEARIKQEDEADAQRRRKRDDEHARVKKQHEEEDARLNKQREDAAMQRHQQYLAMNESRLKERSVEDAEHERKEEAHEQERFRMRLKSRRLKRAYDEHAEEQTGSSLQYLSPPSKKHQPNPAASQPSTLSPKPVQPPPPQAVKQERHAGAQHSISYNLAPPQGSSYDNGGFNPPADETWQSQPSPAFSTPISSSGPRQLEKQPPIGGPGPSPQAPLPPHMSQTILPQPSLSRYDCISPLNSANDPADGGLASISPSVYQPLQTGETAAQAKEAAQPSAKSQGRAPKSAASHSPPHPPGRASHSGTPASTENRKASTSHPYSQSEAFAKRHQPCERTDKLGRGVWTYFGPGGSRDAPTVAGIREMYLRCPHDNCMRMDWRTIHGLQCHIVKTHTVARGTIGSLELALEHYGVGVDEIEDYEKKHGSGSAGTRVEKGSSKAKSRAQRSNGMSTQSPSGPAAEPRATSASASTSTTTSISRPLASTKPKPSTPLVLFPNLTPRSSGGGYLQENFVYSDYDSNEDEPSAARKASTVKENLDAFQRAAGSEGSHSPAPQALQDQDVRRVISRRKSAQQAREKQISVSDSPNLRPSTAGGKVSTNQSVLAPITAVWSSQSPTQGSRTEKSISSTEQANGITSPGDRRSSTTTTAAPTTATPRKSDSSQPTQTSQAQQQAKAQPQDNRTSTSSTKTPTSGTFRPRVPASERWTWVSVQDDDGSVVDKSTNPIKGKDKDDSGAATTPVHTRRKNGNPIVFTEAQQELQGIDSIMLDDDTEGELGRGRDRTDTEEEDSTYSRDPSSAATTSSDRLTPTTSRHTARMKAARMKTRRMTEG